MVIAQRRYSPGRGNSPRHAYGLPRSDQYVAHAERIAASDLDALATAFRHVHKDILG
jgi:hypothetical protein